MSAETPVQTPATEATDVPAPATTTETPAESQAEPAEAKERKCTVA